MPLSRDSLGFTLLLGALAGLPALSIDMSLPALQLIRSDFAAAPAMVTLSLSLFMAGFGGAQLVIGPVSDRVGRRPVMIASIGLYLIGGLACWMAPGLAALLAGRCVQGAGAAGGTVLAFAVIRDLFDGEAIRARLSTVSMVFSLAPVIAPTLGGIVLGFGDWRTIFAVQAVMGVALLAAVILGLPESRRDLPPPPYLAIFGARRTWAFGVVGALNLGNVFCFVAGAPMILLGDLGLDTTTFGAVFAVLTAGVMSGAWINRLIVRWKLSPLVPLGLGLGGTALGAVAGWVIGGAWLHTLWLLGPIFFLTTLSRGLVSPNVTHAALERIPQMAGAGSAVIGAMQMLTGALAGFIVGMMFDRFGVAGVIMTMTGFAVPAVLAWIWVERRYR